MLVVKGNAKLSCYEGKSFTQFKDKLLKVVNNFLLQVFL